MKEIDKFSPPPELKEFSSDNYIDNDHIFATGVFLNPIRIVINGKRMWAWIAEGFEDDSYYNGEVCDPKSVSDTYEGLLKLQETEED